MDPITVDTTFIASIFTLFADAIAVFMEEPLVWFVYLGLVAAVLGMAKRLIPRKRAR